MGQEETLKLVETPWACVELESLVLAEVSIGLTLGTTWQGGLEETGVMSSSPSCSFSPLSLENRSGPQSDLIAQFPQGPGLQPYHWQLAAAGGNNNGGSSRSSSQGELIPQRYGSLAKQRLFEQIRRLPKLTRLSLNHVSYSLEGPGANPSPQ